MIYFLQIIVYMALMYGVYLLVLKNRTTHTWSRAYLLATAIIPVMIPFIQLPQLAAAPVEIVITEVTAPVITISSKINNTPVLNQTTILLLVYTLIGLMLLARLVWQYIKMQRFIKSNNVEVIEGIKVLRNDAIEPGSWNNYIFLPKDEINELILNHEIAHVKLKHSWDIIFIRMLQCFFWPNIILYIIEKELKVVHEFQADEFVKENKELYAQTLLNHVFNTNQFSLSHTFFHKPLKRRITMLGKKASASLRIRVAVIAISLTVLLLGSILIFQGCKRDNINSNTQALNNGEKVYEYVDKMPESKFNIAEFLSKNLVYPEAAKNRKIEGRVTLKFIVDKDGDVQHINVLRSPDTILSQAAIEAVKKMPKWIPGENAGEKVPVYMTLPIAFKLDGETENNKTAIQPINTQSALQKKQSPPFKAIMDNPAGGVFEMVDKMPECPYDYNTFLANNLKYPKEAQDKKIEGRVLLRFVVGADGSIQNLSVVKSPDPLLSKAALDVISKMPKWLPGEKDGKKVAVYFNLPINFKLSN